MKIKEFKNGWSVVMDRGLALTSVILRNSAGNVVDKIRCDDPSDAKDYFKSFCKIAKNS